MVPRNLYGRKLVLRHPLFFDFLGILYERSGFYLWDSGVLLRVLRVYCAFDVVSSRTGIVYFRASLFRGFRRFKCSLMRYVCALFTLAILKSNVSEWVRTQRRNWKKVILSSCGKGANWGPEPHQTWIAHLNTGLDCLTTLDNKIKILKEYLPLFDRFWMICEECEQVTLFTFCTMS